MNINSKSINANDLDGVYDYFDSVVNQMIRNEMDTDNFPTLQEFTMELGVLIDRLDGLLEDINPRVEAYLESKAEEARLKKELEEIQQRLGDVTAARIDKFGGGGGSDGNGIYDVDDEGNDVEDIDDMEGFDDIGDEFDTRLPSGKPSAVVEGRSLINFDISVDELMSDTEELSVKALFDDDAAEELQRKREAEAEEDDENEEDYIDDDELFDDLHQALDPMDIFTGKVEKGDTYDDLTPELDLYEPEDDDEDNDDDDDEYGFGFPSDSDYRYEDDDDDGYSRDERDYYDDDDSNGYDGLYDDEFENDYGSRGGRRHDDDGFSDDWDEGGDPFGGRNIDQLLTSANMTL